MKSALRVVVLTATMVLFCVPVESVWSQNELEQTDIDIKDDPEAYQLGEVVVSAGGTGVEAVGTTRKVTRQDIKDMNARSLDEAIRFTPGVLIRTGNAGTPRIDIRGFRTRHVLMLLDGVPFNSTYDGQFDPTLIPTENIARIKVSTGGGSLLYGPGGNGGIINIVTRKGREGMRGEIGLEGAEGSSVYGRTALSGASGGLDGFLSASYRDRDWYPLSDDFEETDEQTGDKRDNSDRERQNFFGQVGYHPSDFTYIGLSANGFQGENGVPPVTNYDKNDPFTKKPKYDRTDDISGNTAQLAFSHEPGGFFGVRGWFYYSRSDQEDNRYDDDTYSTQKKNGASQTNSDTDVYGGNLQLKGDLGDFGAATLGLIATEEEWDGDGFSVNKSNEREYFDRDEKTSTYTTALEYEWSPFEKLGIVAGASYHWFDGDNDVDDSDWSYLLGATYDLFEGTRFKAYHSRRVRFPSIRQLYDPDGGNEDLEAENTRHYEIGVEQALPANTLVSATAYRIDAKDFIEKDETDVYTNFEDLRFQGFEIALENRFVSNLMLRASYAYLDAEDRGADSERAELQHRPKDTFSFEGVYRFDFGLTLRGSVLYIANQYFYDSDGEDPLEKKKLNDIAVVDVKASYMLVDEMLEIYAGADNLFDEDYEESYGLPQAGQVLYAGVEFRY